MVKLYKNWYLDADDHQYVVGRTTEDLRSGNLVRSIDDPVKFDTAVEAIQHVLETETRDIVKEPDVMNLVEFLATYSGIADGITENLLSLSKELIRASGRHYDPRQQIETRGA